MMELTNVIVRRVSYCLNPSIKTENKFLFKPGMKMGRKKRRNILMSKAN